MAARATVVIGPSGVVGPWAALTAFALVPAGLAGADIGALLAAANDAPAAGGDAALRLGALLSDVDVVALDGQEPLAEWVAALLATGLAAHPLPVLVEKPGAPDWEQRRTIAVGATTGNPAGADIVTAGGPADQMLLWQHAIAAAARLRAPVPPAAPTTAAPAVPEAQQTPAFADGMVEVFAPWLPPGTATVADALRALVTGADGVTVPSSPCTPTSTAATTPPRRCCALSWPAAAVSPRRSAGPNAGCRRRPRSAN